MSKGTVKFFNNAKGFGFISEEGTDKEHFVHVSGLIDEIKDGDE
ncbi:MAG: cold shock domain-containing protein, partial [Prolixibacteraceae bacterium]|nr:cold shock domain-containing protein [Prolixibacteraceae bacterium]